MLFHLQYALGVEPNKPASNLKLSNKEISDTVILPYSRSGQPVAPPDPAATRGSPMAGSPLSCVRDSVLPTVLTFGLLPSRASHYPALTLHLRHAKGDFILCHLKSLSLSRPLFFVHPLQIIFLPRKCFPDELTDMGCNTGTTLPWSLPARQAPLSPAHPCSASQHPTHPLQAALLQGTQCRATGTCSVSAGSLTDRAAFTFSRAYFLLPDFCFPWWKQSFVMHNTKYFGKAGWLFEVVLGNSTPQKPVHYRLRSTTQSKGVLWSFKILTDIYTYLSPS